MIVEIDDNYWTIDRSIEDCEEGIELYIYGKEIEDVKNVSCHLLSYYYR